MNRRNQYALTVLIYIYVSVIKAEVGFFELTTLPSGPKFSPGETVTFRCAILKARTSVSSGLQWFRLQGTVSLQIATEVMLNYDFISNNRYEFSRGADTATTTNYYLKIKNLVLEDSSTIQCGLPQFSQKASRSFAVCDFPKNKSCDCMIENGWSSPACFDYLVDAKEKADSYRRATIGLGIGLGVAVILAVVLTVYFIRDCIHQVRAKRMKTESTVDLNPPESVPAGLPGASVLKQPSQSAAATGGHSVRFSENGNALNEATGARQRQYPASNSSNLYPNLDSYLTPAGDSNTSGFQDQMQRERGYINSHGLSRETYQPSYGVQHTAVPYASDRGAGALPRTENVYIQGPGFIDPGSTSI